jgi:hypothetical protein
MAQGDVVVFDQACVDVLEALHDLENNDIRLGLITSAVTPAATDADPRWGAGGGTNYSTNQVTPGGNYASGGPSIPNPAVTLTGGLAQFDGDDVTITQNAANPTNARWAIGYNFTDAGRRALFFVDLGAVFDLTTGDLQFVWNVNGIARLNN